MRLIQWLLMFIGRVLISSLFLFLAADYVLYWNTWSERFSSAGVQMASLTLILAIIVKAIGGLCLLFSFWTRLGAFALLVVLVLETLLFHRFWAMPMQEQELHFFNFFRNVALCGGLLYVIACGNWGVVYKKLKRVEKIKKEPIETEVVEQDVS